MKDFYRAAIKIIVAFLIAIVVINDMVAVITTHWKASQAADKIADEAEAEYVLKKGPRMEELARKLYADAEEIAAQEEVQLDVWQIDQGQLTVTVSKRTERTFFVHYVARYVEFLRPYLSGTSTRVVDLSS